MYDKIMVQTDGSGFDREAIRVAQRIADSSHAEIRLVRVVSSRGCSGRATPSNPPNLSVEAKKSEVSAALAELNALAAECRVAGEAPVSTELLDGPQPRCSRATLTGTRSI